MKRCFFLVLTLFVLSACAAQADAPPSDVRRNLNDETVTPAEPDGISLSVDSASVTQSGLTYTIQNTSETKFGTGYDFFIAQKQEGSQDEWTELPWIAGEPEWRKPLITPWDDTTEWSTAIDWESIYGPLSAGDYLLVKEIVSEDESLHYYLAEKFTVPAS